MNIILTGRIPSKKNSRISNKKTGRSFPSKDYTIWHKDALKQLPTLPAPFPAIKSISIKIYFPTLRKSDITNKVESVNDLLVDGGILSDDNYFVLPALHLFGEYRKNQGGAEINIEEKP
jgi:Holliday junction resolvase RusA-like endonuclease